MRVPLRVSLMGTYAKGSYCNSMRAYTIALILAFSASLAACSTKYQAVGLTGGFSETQLAPNVYRVSFRGNALTSTERVHDFALLRAAELCLAGGLKHFVVADAVDQSRVHAITEPATAETRGHATFYGDTAAYSGTTTYNPAKTYNIYKPGLGLVVQCLDVQPDGVFAFDAEFVRGSLRSKYGLP